MRHWMLTLKEDMGHMSSLKAWFVEHCECATWALEVGDGGYRHWQIYVCLLTKKRQGWFKHHFHRVVHAEACRNIDRCIEYPGDQVKSGTIEMGPFAYPEPLAPVPDPLMGKTPYAWQQEVLDLVKQEPDPRKVHWYWDAEGNRGKTALAAHLVIKRGARYFTGGKKADLLFAYEGERIVIVDLARTTENFAPYEALENLKNGIMFSGKYVSATKVFAPPHLIVLANYPPDESKLSADRWVITEIR